MEELKMLKLNKVQEVPEKVMEQVEQSAAVVTQSMEKTNRKFPVAIIVVLILLLGVGSGFGLFKATAGNPTTEGVDSTGQLTAGVTVGQVFGNQDEKTFKDHAEGVLEAGTASGEGSHSLLREGGPSKTANLTSSIIDLDQFVGMRVEIWGETFSAQKSGWLMDVGRIKVLELNAPKPE